MGCAADREEAALPVNPAATFCGQDCFPKEIYSYRFISIPVYSIQILISHSLEVPQMHQLPVELLHDICEKLYVCHVREFRLVNRACAAVGIKYLLPEVFFFSHPDACEGLRETAHHPEFRFHVKSLLYDGRHVYQRFADRGEWEVNLRRRDYLAATVGGQEVRWQGTLRREAEETEQTDENSEITPGELLEVSDVVSSDGPEGMYEFESTEDRYFRKHPKRVTHRTEEKLEKHYNFYLKTIKQQDDMWRENRDFEAIEYAVGMFPTLKSVRFSSDRFIYGWHRLKDTAVRKAFADTFCKPSSRNRNGADPPQGLRQLNALLTAVFNANIKLDQVEAGSLSWRFFAQEKSVMRKMMQATHCITHINLLLDTASDEEYIEMNFEGAQCRKYLSHGSLRRFLQNIPNLTSLKVIFNIDYEPNIVLPATIRDLVGDGVKWPKLKEFGVGGIEAKEPDLLAFLDDHKDTLRRLEINTMMLDAGESWISMLPKIQQMLKLDKASLCGVLCAGGSTVQLDESWDIATDDSFSGNPVRQELAKYMVEGGKCPLYPSNMQFRH